MASPDFPDRRILSEAAEWFAVLHGTQANESDRQRWRAWLGASDSPQAYAWQRVQAISDQFGVGREPAARQALHASMNRRRQVLRSLLATGGVGMGAWMATNTRPWQAWASDHHSGVGEVRQLALPDGTRAWLNTDSAIDLRYTDTVRELRLVRGEVHVATASAASEMRPFIVTTRYGAARALGTRYTVRLLDSSAAVAVYEGAVAVRPAELAQDQLVVPAGRQATLSLASALDAGAADLARREWTRGMLLANDVPLGDFIQELGRYRHGYLGCAPDVAQLRLVGSYPADDTDTALAMITRTLPVVVRRRSNWWVTLVARPTAVAAKAGAV